MADLEIDLSGATQWCDATAPPTIPVATAVAVSPTFPNFSTSNVLTSQSLQVLRDQGFPMGLARELGNTKATYPIRFWIVDNSGYDFVSVCLWVCVNVHFACGCGCVCERSEKAHGVCKSGDGHWAHNPFWNAFPRRFFTRHGYLWMHSWWLMGQVHANLGWARIAR